MMHIKKKGQLTIFIILGIVILIAFSFLFYAKSSYVRSLMGRETAQIGAFDAPVRSFVESCIKQVAVEGAYYVASQGGHYTLPPNPLNVVTQGQEFMIGYGYRNQQDVMISKTIMQKEYEDYIEGNLNLCIADFASFPDYRIEASTPEVSIDLGEDKAVVSINYPLIIRRGDDETKISKFQDVVVPVRMGKLYDIVKTLIDYAEQYPERGPNLSYISTLLRENIRVYYGWTDNALYYMISDFESSVQSGAAILPPSVSNKQFLFNVALDYS